MNILRSTSWRMRSAVVALAAASLAACGETAGPDDDVSTSEMQNVAVALEAVAAQSIFTDLFGTQVMPGVQSAAGAREVALETRAMLQVAARSVDDGGMEPANAFPDDVKGKTFVPTSSGDWAWDPALPQPGPQTARFIARNSLGQTRGHLDITDLQAAGSVLRYRAELFTIANLRVMDFINELTEVYVGTELASYTYDVDGLLTDGQTNISFDYRIAESSLNTATPSGTETYSVQVPRLEVGMTLSGTMSANGWSTEYTLRVRNAELRWVLGTDNSVRFYRNGQHLATGTWDEFDNQTYWRTPSGQTLGSTLQQFVEAADRASEAMFAPVTATLLVDDLVVRVLY
jgi:hypothetical protein